MFTPQIFFKSTTVYTFYLTRQLSMKCEKDGKSDEAFVYKKCKATTPGRY